MFSQISADIPLPFARIFQETNILDVFSAELSSSSSSSYLVR
jgi:hypothetical protein